jgi:hypothetical protein
MTDETRHIRQISGNLEKFQSGGGGVSHFTPKVVTYQGFGADLKVLNTSRRGIQAVTSAKHISNGKSASRQQLIDDCWRVCRS